MGDKVPASLKDEGNTLFSQGNYAEALEVYTKALQEVGEDAVLRSNLAAAHLKVKQPGEALTHADRAVELRPDWEKAHFRRGCALEAQGNLEQAMEAFRTALQLNPGSQELRNRVIVTERALANKAGRGQPTGAAGEGKERRRRREPRQCGFGAGESQGRPEVPMPGPAAWATGLSQAKRYEWLVDCYRMRIDDDYVYGGGNLHGLYDPDATKETVVQDFLVFCKLAVLHEVIPQQGWSWPDCLGHATQELPYAFEKSDAKAKWGGENVFRPFLGGRSLRFTGEAVMGSSCMEPGAQSKEEQQVARQVRKQGRAVHQELSGVEEALFTEVGGGAAWRKLLRDMPEVQHGYC
ncbi:hypothetical protein N2152v2_004324 [Parachlorella kessleri]